MVNIVAFFHPRRHRTLLARVAQRGPRLKRHIQNIRVLPCLCGILIRNLVRPQEESYIWHLPEHFLHQQKQKTNPNCSFPTPVWFLVWIHLPSQPLYIWLSLTDHPVYIYYLEKPVSQKKAKPPSYSTTFKTRSLNNRA